MNSVAEVENLTTLSILYNADHRTTIFFYSSGPFLSLLSEHQSWDHDSLTFSSFVPHSFPTKNHKSSVKVDKEEKLLKKTLIQIERGH